MRKPLSQGAEPPGASASLADAPVALIDGPAGLADTLTFPFVSRTLACRGGTMHYIDEGAGPTLLLLHPAVGTLFIYKRLALALRRRFRIVAPDLLGFGLSRPNHDFTHTLDEHADAVNDFVERLGLEVDALLVNDTSGPIGLGAAGRRPDLYRTLIITDTFGFPLRGRFLLVKVMLRFILPFWPVRWLNRRLNLLAWMVSTIAPYRNPLPRAERQLYQQFFPTAESRDRIIDLFSQLGRGDDFLACVETAIQQKLASKQVLLLYGQLDPVRMIGFLAKFRQLFPNAQQVIIPREEHFPILGSADVVASAIESWYDLLSPETEEEWSNFGPRKASA